MFEIFTPQIYYRNSEKPYFFYRNIEIPMKELINQRFIKAVNYIISKKIETKKGEIAKKLNLSSSSFSEILKQRMHTPIEAISLLSSNYGISLYWIINDQGEMVKNENTPTEVSILNSKINNQQRQIDQLYGLVEILAAKLDISKDSLYSLTDKIK